MSYFESESCKNNPNEIKGQEIVRYEFYLLFCAFLAIK